MEFILVLIGVIAGVIAFCVWASDRMVKDIRKYNERPCDYCGLKEPPGKPYYSHDEDVHLCESCQIIYSNWYVNSDGETVYRCNRCKFFRPHRLEYHLDGLVLCNECHSEIKESAKWEIVGDYVIYDGIVFKRASR